MFIDNSEFSLVIYLFKSLTPFSYSLFLLLETLMHSNSKSWLVIGKVNIILQLTALIQLFYKTKILHFKCVEINCVFHLLFCVYRYVFCVCILIFKIIIMRSYILLNYILIPSRLYFYNIQVSIVLQFVFFSLIWTTNVSNIIYYIIHPLSSDVVVKPLPLLCSESIYLYVFVSGAISLFPFLNLNKYLFILISTYLATYFVKCFLFIFLYGLYNVLVYHVIFRIGKSGFSSQYHPCLTV